MIRAVRNLLLLGALIALALPAAAQADPVTDCAKDGKLDASYSNSQLKQALGDIPGDLDEYSDCRHVIGAAIHGGGSSGAKGNDSAPITPQEQAARDQDSRDLAALTGGSGHEQSPDLSVGGEHVKPGSNGLFDLASSSNDLPTPLLVSLIAVGLLILGTGLVVLRERVPALARIPLLSKIPAPRGSLPRFRR